MNTIEYDDIKNVTIQNNTKLLWIDILRNCALCLPYIEEKCFSSETGNKGIPFDDGMRIKISKEDNMVTLTVDEFNKNA